METAELLARGFRVSRPTHFVENREFNYYPAKGKITIDLDPSQRHPKKWFNTLIELLDEAVYVGRIKL